jgi:hypothetical protein
VPPETPNSPSEGTPKPEPTNPKARAQGPPSNLHIHKHVRASQGHLLGLLVNLFLDFRAHPLPPPLKQPQTEVSCEQFALPGDLHRLSGQRKLT